MKMDDLGTVLKELLTSVLVKSESLDPERDRGAYACPYVAKFKPWNFKFNVQFIHSMQTFAGDFTPNFHSMQTFRQWFIGTFFIQTFQ